jgi:predicted transcriptional regulator
MSISLSFRTQETIREQIDKIAAALDRPRNWVINDAIANYIELHNWQLEQIREGERDIKEGRSYTTPQVRARLQRHMAKHSKSRKSA